MNIYKFYKIIFLIIIFFYFPGQSIFGKNIEIIIPGTKRYSIYDFFYKSEKELWSIHNVSHLHKNMENRLGISVVTPGMQELNQTNINLTEKDKFIKYQEQNFPDTSYFFFNWPGKKTAMHRIYAALRLYLEIKKLKALYPSKKIIILAHSHGGNIALEMSYWINILKDDDFYVDELYLFGTPIGKKTEQWAMSKNSQGSYIFKKVINFYHQKDIFQVADILFDIKCKRKLECKRENIYNQESFFKVSHESFFQTLYLYHVHLFTIDFLCTTFLKIRKKYTKDDTK